MLENAKICPECRNPMSGGSCQDEICPSLEVQLIEEEKQQQEAQEVTKIQTTTNRTKNQVRKYKCSTCNRKFQSEMRFTAHTCGATLSFKCPFKECSKTFNNPSSFNYHVNIHEGKRPYKCKFCIKTFRAPSHLNYHISSHFINGKKLVCGKSGCTQTFRNKNQLNQHRVVHKIGTHECNNCRKLYKSKRNLRVSLQMIAWIELNSKRY